MSNLLNIFLFIIVLMNIQINHWFIDSSWKIKANSTNQPYSKTAFSTCQTSPSPTPKTSISPKNNPKNSRISTEIVAKLTKLLKMFLVTHYLSPPSPTSLTFSIKKTCRLWKKRNHKTTLIPILYLKKLRKVNKEKAQTAKKILTISNLPTPPKCQIVKASILIPKNYSKWK